MARAPIDAFDAGHLPVAVGRFRKIGRSSSVHPGQMAAARRQVPLSFPEDFTNRRAGEVRRVQDHRPINQGNHDLRPALATFHQGEESDHVQGIHNSPAPNRAQAVSKNETPCSLMQSGP
jgi:hypothetical protein